MNGNETFFGVNFADGRIKGYPKYRAKYGESKYYLRLVRGNKKYGDNIFIDNKNGTIIDIATNLTWMKDDSKKGMNWEESLQYCENLNYASSSKWRLPNAKELQSLVDYTKSPNATNSAAIDSLFNISSIRNEGGQKDYPSFWSSTTHLEGKKLGGSAVYISFGRALGYMKTPKSFSKELMDVHGAGAQRSDPKNGTISWYSNGRGPQGDVVRIKNYVRCVTNELKSFNKNINIEKEINKSKKLKINRTNHPVLDRFDKNNDSKISYKEAPKKMQNNFHKHDLNKDGFIDTEELKTLPKRP